MCVFLYPSNQKKIQTIPNQIFIQTILVIVKHLEEEHSTEVLHTIQTRAFHLDRFASLKENNTDRRRDTNIWARFLSFRQLSSVSLFYSANNVFAFILALLASINRKNSNSALLKYCIVKFFFNYRDG